MARPSLREQLLVAGLDSFHRRGFNGTSVQDITDAAGAPKGSFYNHFLSKEALAAEAVRKYVELRRSVHRDLLRDTKLKPLRRLRKYFESLNQAAAKAAFSSGCLLGNFGAEVSGYRPLISKRLGEAFAGWTDAVAAVIREGQKAREISRDFSPAELAAFTIHAWEGALLRAKVAKNSAPLDLFLDVTFDKILA
jgi:TetR/AcrR family transcriptional regulator, transcriptional repressor for nem operon